MPREAQSAISIRGLTKRFGSLSAVRDLDLDVGEGEVLGFLGLNGAGKTTTIRMLLDLLRPTAGCASIFGHDCRRDGLRARALAGYLPGELGLHPDLTGRATLDLLARLDRQAADGDRRSELQERLELPDADLERRLREYSAGMKRKLGLIQALEADRPLLILDEPTDGLDPLMQDAFSEIVSDLRRRGKTVFMSSHVLSEVERICDRVALLRRGELVLHSTVEDVRRMAPRRVRVFFRSAVEPPASLPPGYDAVSLEPTVWTLRVEGVLGPLASITAALPVDDIRVDEPKLEDVILRYYREEAS